MRFWDASALVPLLLEEPLTDVARRWVEEDPELVVWWGSLIECTSAIARLDRQGDLLPSQVQVALEHLLVLANAWFEITPTQKVRELAIRLLRVHPLRAADALQLAAALEWAGVPPDRVFLTFDQRLAQAARAEGLRVLEG